MVYDRLVDGEIPTVINILALSKSFLKIVSNSENSKLRIKECFSSIKIHISRSTIFSILHNINPNPNLSLNPNPTYIFIIFKNFKFFEFFEKYKFKT